MRRRAAITVILFFSVLLLPGRAAPQKPPQQKTFDLPTASGLLMQLSDALEAHSRRQFLAVFDLGKMKDGPGFSQQIISFFSHTESFRVHMNLAEIGAENGQATVTVDAEMEGQPGNGQPVWRRNQRLNFAAAGDAGSWKFVEVQPRSFFSLP